MYVLCDIDGVHIPFPGPDGEIPSGFEIDHVVPTGYSEPVKIWLNPATGVSCLTRSPHCRSRRCGAPVGVPTPHLSSAPALPCPPGTTSTCHACRSARATPMATSGNAILSLTSYETHSPSSGSTTTSRPPTTPGPGSGQHLEPPPYSSSPTRTPGCAHRTLSCYGPGGTPECNVRNGLGPSTWLSQIPYWARRSLRYASRRDYG